MRKKSRRPVLNAIMTLATSITLYFLLCIAQLYIRVYSYDHFLAFLPTKIILQSYVLVKCFITSRAEFFTRTHMLILRFDPKESAYLSHRFASGDVLRGVK